MASGARSIFGKGERAHARRARVRRAGSVLGAFALASSSLTWVTIGIAPQAVAAPGDPFDPATSYVFVAQNVPTVLNQAVTDASGTVSFLAQGGNSQGVEYNGIGYSTSTNYLYGVAQSAAAAPAIPQGAVVRIGQNGVVTRVGTSIVNISAKAGAINGNRLYLGVGNGQAASPGGVDDPKTVVVVNPANGNITSTFTLPSPANVSDWTFANGYAWGVNGGQIVRIDLLNAPYDVETFSPALLPDPGAYGAAWTFGNGNLGFSNNTTGNVYQVSVSNPASSSPTFKLVSSVAGPMSNLNDGASSPGAPADLSITKTGPTNFAPGGTLTYTLTVTNNGPNASSGSVVSDTLPAGLTNVQSATSGCAVDGREVTCTNGPLANGASKTITITADSAANAAACITNTADVLGNELDLVASNNTSSVTSCPVAITLDKTVSPTTLTEAGQGVQYSFVVKNTGARALSSVSVTEDEFTGTGTAPVVTCPVATLAVGATTTCTASYTATQADVDAGTIENTATAHGTPPTGTAISSSPAEATVTIPAQPSLSLVKSVAETELVLDVPLTYSFVITNDGNVTMSDVHVEESGFTGSGTPPVVTCPAGVASMAPGAQVTCAATYTVVQDDIDDAVVSNTAVAVGTPPVGPDVDSAPDSAQVPHTATPSIGLVKTVSPTTANAAGDVVTYSFRVTNTGDVSLTAIDITEDEFTGTGTDPDVTCPATASLAPGASIVCTGTYSLTQADVDAGAVANTATAHGTPPSGTEVDSTPSSAELTIEPDPSLTIEKSVTDTELVLGDTLDYSFVLTNNGNVTLAPVTVVETAFSGHGVDPVVSCPPAANSLAPLAQVTCTATYVVTQDDVDSGKVQNTAIGRGTPPSGPAVPSDPDAAVVPHTPGPALTIVKSATPSTVSTVGAAVTYRFLLENIGDVTLRDVGVVEESFSGSGSSPQVTCPPSADVMLPGAVVECTAAYVLTQADVDAGSVTNTAHGTGTPPSGPPVESPPSTTTVTVPGTPGLTVAKSSSPAQVAAAGDVVTYQFLMTNTGNVTLVDVHPVEGSFSGSGDLAPVVCPPAAASMAPGSTVTCAATYEVTQADIDAGEISNTATGTGTPPPTSPPLPPVPPTTTTTEAPAAPSISLHKSVAQTDLVLGDALEYDFVVTNTGNVTLAPVTVAETAFTGSGTTPSISCPPAASSLAPLAQVTCTATYAVTQLDVDAGSVDNTARATGTPPVGPAVSSNLSSAAVPGALAPGLKVTKSVTPTTVSTAGSVLTYRFLLENTGTTTLTDVAVVETEFTGTGELSDITCPAGAASLAPGAFVACTATYTVTQADADAGGFENSATAAGTPPPGSPPLPPVPPSTVVVDIDPEPGLTVTKSVDASELELDETITYTFVATNTGNVTLTGLTIDDVGFSGDGALSTVTCPTTTLAPTEQAVCTATYTVTQGDVDAGSLTNTATATGTPPTGPPVVSPPDSARIPNTPAPGLSILKAVTPQSVALAGEQITYTFTLRNTGDVTLTDVEVADTEFTGTGSLSAIACPAGATSLAPGASLACSATYTVTQQDVDRGALSNSATAGGTPPPSAPPLPPVPPSTVVVPIPAAPSLHLDKSVSPSTVAEVGEVVTYTFVVTNDGNVTIDDVSVEETSFSGTGTAPVIDCPVSVSLAPTSQVVCSATYEVTQDDIDAGVVTNVAMAVGALDSDEVQSPTDDAVVDAPADPAVTVVKSASPSDPASYVVGQRIDYSFVVENTGNVTLTDVEVTDSDFTGSGDLSAIACPAAIEPLTPGEQVSCTATYVLTQLDVDAGELSNSATVAGTPPNGPPVDGPPTEVTIPADPAPRLSVVKTADVQTVTKAGETVTYSFVLTNTGNVTLRDARPVEGEFSGAGTLGAIECPAAANILLPGQDVTCTAAYTVVQADLDAGSVSNTATATATPPPGAPGLPPTTPSRVTVPSGAAAGKLDLVKTATPKDLDGDGRTGEDDRIEWSMLVTNSGGVTVSGIVVSDPTAGEVTCPHATLPPGASMTCTTLSHVVTAADVSAGEVVNTAVATGSGVAGRSLTSGPSTAAVEVAPQAPSTQSPVPLASTGANTLTQIAVSLAFTASGLALVLATRRRRSMV